MDKKAQLITQKKSLWVVMILSMTFGYGFVYSSTAIQPDPEKWVAPEEAKEITNPTATSKKSVKNGEKIFKQYCVVCHGSGGIGDGPGSKALNPKPANLTSADVQAQVDGEIFWKLSNGRGAMVAWGPIIKEDDRWDIVNFIRSIKAEDN